MAGDPIPIEFRIKRSYTLLEAVELMKIYDGYTNIRWINTRTGKPILIGYND